MTERSGTRIPVVRALLGAALGLGAAVLLSTRLGPLPGFEPRDDVVGFLSRHDLGKSREGALFYGALALVPLGAFLALRIPAERLRSSWRRRSGRLASREEGATPRADLVLPWLAAWISITVAALAAGPRVASPMPLGPGAVRVASVAGAALVVALGLRLATHALANPEASARAARGLSLLLLVRFVPDRFGPVAAVCAAAAIGFAVALVRARPGGGLLPVGDRWFRVVFLPALVGTLVFHPDVNGDLDAYHAGEWLTPASMVADGALPYRDVWLQHGLGQNVLRPWLTFALLERSFAADALARNLMHGVAHAALLLLLLATLRSRLLAAGLALMLASPGLAVSPRLTFFLLALAAAAWHVRRARAPDGSVRARPRLPAALAGVSAAFALVHSLDAGLFAVASVGPFLLLEGASRRGTPFVPRFAPVAWFLAGLVAGAAPFVLALAAAGAGPAMLANTRDQLALQLSVWGLPFPSPTSLVEAARADGAVAALASPLGRAWLAAAAAVGVVTAVVARTAVGRARRLDLMLLVLSLGGAALFRTALGRSDDGHLAYASALLWPLLALVGEAAWRTRDAGRPALVRALPLALAFGFLVGGHAPLYGVARQWLRLSEVRPTGPGNGFSTAPLPSLRGVLIPDDQARALAAIAAWLDERLPPGAPFVEFSNLGALHFLLDRPCPTRYAQAAYAATPERQREWIADLERSRPRVLITCPLLGDGTIDGLPLAERLPRIAAHLAATYRPLEATSFGAVFERVEPARSASEPLLDRVPGEPSDDR
ncbi:MAG: hypothetical protein ACF8XB_07925 [Planctomycetota bacterium JB042]